MKFRVVKMSAIVTSLIFLMQMFFLAKPLKDNKPAQKNSVEEYGYISLNGNVPPPPPTKPK